MSGRRRFIVVGTGTRGTSMWIQSMLEHYAAEAEPVGLYDINPGRARACNTILKTSIPYQKFCAESIARSVGGDSGINNGPWDWLCSGC